MMNLKVAGQLSEQDEEEEKSCELLVLSCQFCLFNFLFWLVYSVQYSYTYWLLTLQFQFQYLKAGRSRATILLSAIKFAL